jgi:hypothetical protein
MLRSHHHDVLSAGTNAPYEAISVLGIVVLMLLCAIGPAFFRPAPGAPFQPGAITN